MIVCVRRNEHASSAVVWKSARKETGSVRRKATYAVAGCWIGQRRSARENSLRKISYIYVS